MSRPFKAKYDGQCPACSETIHDGDMLVWTDNGDAVHTECRDPKPDPKIDRPTCSECWQQASVTGACGCDA